MFSDHHDRRHRDHDGDGGSRSDDRSRSRTKADDPPNSRLFIMCGKNITESQLRTAFGEFGTIEEVWVLKDRASMEHKGIAYIKFSRTSEAALAMEEMNGKVIAGDPRPLKVLIAHAKDQGSRREANEEERLLRLFVMVPRSVTEADLRHEFSRYGDIDYVSVVKDYNTRESKGFAYVKYHRASHAAKAFESCDSSYRPVFAEPKPSKRYGDDSAGPGSTASGSTVGSSHAMHHVVDGQCRLIVLADSRVTQNQLWKLFDIVPGLDYCELRQSGGSYRPNPRGENTFVVQFNNAQSSAYAREKLHGFEYPPGGCLNVKHEVQPQLDSKSGRVPPPALPLNLPKGNVDIAQLTETIANATALLKAAGYGSGGSGSGDTYDPSYCSVKLPPPQPLADPDAVVAERLFIVCTPQPPPSNVLKDVFSRFGDLIEVYIMGRKTCGYAKYTSKESANRALEALHGQEICGNRLKVMLAEPQENARKRPKIDGSSYN